MFSGGLQSIEHSADPIPFPLQSIDTHLSEIVRLVGISLAAGIDIENRNNRLEERRVRTHDQRSRTPPESFSLDLLTVHDLYH